MKRVIAIVPAAGLGRRFGSGINKPFQNLMGKPLVVWPLETLGSVNEITEVVPVLKEEDMERGVDVFEGYGLSKIKRIAPGGKERQDSVYNALKLVEDRNCIVLIHDGVRPLIEKAFIQEALKYMSEILRNREDCDGVILGVPLKDTIKEVRSQKSEVRNEIIVEKTLNRDLLWSIQTPQVFPYSSIVSAYEKAMEEGFYSTDDSAIVERYGGKVKVMMGSYKNIKITTPEDLLIAEFLMGQNK